MIKENRTSKYLLYAIGEIILVVIGILIALQINNWNQEGILKIEEKNIVKNLHNEYLQNKNIIQKSIEESDSSMHTLKSIMNLMGKDEEFINKHNSDSLMYYALDFPIFRPSENTISGLIQSGRLELLQNQDLVDLIYEWGRTMKALNDHSERLLIKNDNEVLPYLSKNYSLKDMDVYGDLNWKNQTILEIDKLKIFEAIEFENIMDDFLYRVNECKKKLIELEIIINKILMETEQ
ncbi:hypothetical protein GCM10010976_29910 [Bizionia arctica]|uniref:Uncharacterized protein n=2 Tax=Bizionia arctica TaxID=1495645 RepID=A0A917GTQ6_9FLAO|nr:hypothetical protein GCM10010976_29910 [Bizionia arctica]